MRSCNTGTSCCMHQKRYSGVRVRGFGLLIVKAAKVRTCASFMVQIQGQYVFLFPTPFSPLPFCSFCSSTSPFSPNCHFFLLPFLLLLPSSFIFFSFFLLHLSVSIVLVENIKCNSGTIHQIFSSITVRKIWLPVLLCSSLNVLMIHLHARSQGMQQHSYFS